MGQSKVLLFIAFYLLLSCTKGKKGFGLTDQEWGYVTVRDGAHMFWWLHYTTSEDPNKPLVIWLQGGPGASSTGFGNLGEVGPIDEHLNRRKNAWTDNYNVLFVDNPVGSGFSYVDDTSKLVTNNTEIAKDFLVLLQEFYKKLPKFSQTPLYIFCESYGGKMTAEIALLVYKAQLDGEISSNLKGVALGDAWISPIDSVLTWGPYLLNQGLVDGKGYDRIQKIAEEASEDVDNGKYEDASKLFNKLEEVIGNITSNLDFYNVLTKIPMESQRQSRFGKTIKPIGVIDEDAIYKVMNNEVKKALDLDHEWVSESSDVFQALSADFMKPVTEIVEKLLNETTLQVVVYNGQLDLIVDTPGTIRWVDRLRWNGANEWKNTDNKPMVVDNIIEGFYKKIENFTFYWVSRAGHMVPYDNPNAMDFILKNTMND